VSLMTRMTLATVITLVIMTLMTVMALTMLTTLTMPTTLTSTYPASGATKTLKEPAFCRCHGASFPLTHFG
jgi:hypothetical protein